MTAALTAMSLVIPAELASASSGSPALSAHGCRSYPSQAARFKAINVALRAAMRQGRDPLAALEGEAGFCISPLTGTPASTSKANGGDVVQPFATSNSGEMTMYKPTYAFDSNTGFNVILALRILGIAGSIPIKELRAFVPVMWVGFWMNACSGLLLLIGYPTKALTHPDFYLKMTLIASAMALFLTIRPRVFNESLSAAKKSPSALRRLAWASLVCWAGAIISGRLLAYTYTRLLADWK